MYFFSEIGELVNLDTLNVAGNHLEYLPNEIGKLQKLQKLELYNNTLKRLPICKLKYYNFQ